MSNIDFTDLPDIPNPLLKQPDESMCVGELVRLLTYNLMKIERAFLNSIIPAGLVMFMGGGVESKPSGFVVADGSWYSPDTYPELHEKIGYRYGKRSDSCFRVPDLRGSQIVGLDMGVGCLTDITEWSGKDEETGITEFGDIAGASKQYCSPQDSGCLSKHKHSLMIPLISTGEICI